MQTITRKTRWQTLCLILALILAAACLPSGTAASQAQPPILVSIVMHNEEPPQYPDFVNDEPAFWQQRNALVQFADMLYANGVMFNYQSDWNFLMAAGMYDTGTLDTNGKNVVRYIKEDLGFEVDPHAHETLYNYADVAYLIEALGVTPSHTVGGMVVHPPEISILEQFWQPITGRRYPTYTWQAEITWGGGTKLHQDEELLWASGVWRPKDKYHFLEHDEAAPLPNVGNYGSQWENLDRLLQLQQDGELEDKIHTCTISVRQDDLLILGFIQQFEQRLQARDAMGDIRWVGLAEVIDIWQTEYDSEPNILPYLTPRAYLPLIFKNYTPTQDYYEPPINVTFNVHLDPVLDDYTKWQERKDNLLWLESFVDGYSGEYQPRLNVEVQGDHAEFYLNPTDPEAAEGRAALADLYAAGHSFGTHAHNSLRGEALHSWVKVQGTAAPAEAVESWQDHIGFVEQLYAEITGSSDPEFLQQMNASAVMFLPTGSTEKQLAFAGVYSDPISGETVPHGFSVQTGGRNEHFYCFFDHDVQNPWRPGTQGALDEDLTNTAFVTVPQMPALGVISVHAHIPDCRQDNSVPSRQRMFIQEFLERLYREYTDAPDKVWTFGWHEHLFDIYPTGTSGLGKHDFREDVEQLVDWLNERFIGQTTANGNVVAQYATVTEVRDEFETWEESNPGVSSFELDQYTADWDNYPYELKGLARDLANAHYDAALLPADSALQVYRFERCPSSLRGEAQGHWVEEADSTFSCYDALTGSTPLTTTTVYVAWRDAADAEPTDLTIYAGDWATAYDGVSGDFLAADDALSAYPLDFRPVVILPSATEPAPTGYLVISYNANYLRGSPDSVQQATAKQFVPTLNRHLDLIDGLDGSATLTTGMAADYYFTGLAAEKLAEWSTQTLTRLLDSAYGLHYHGANRPPYPQLVDQVLGEDWEQDVATVRTYETDGLNPAHGAHVGGVTAFRTVFGQDPFATGRFFEASILAVDKEMGVRMAVGLKDNTGASRNDAWLLGVLNRSESLALGPAPLVDAALHDQGEKYLAQVQAQLTSLTDPVPIVAFLIHDHEFFKYAPADQEKIWALYEQVLELTQDLGFRSVTLHDIYALAENGPAPTLTQDELLQAAQTLSQTMGVTGYPPEYVTADSTPYSLAESFEALAHALAAYHQTDSLPASVDTHDLLGPTVVFHSDVTPATVPADDVLDAAGTISAAITDRLPSQTSVGSQTVNPAEFLYLMAQEYTAIAQGVPAPVTLRSISALPLAVIQNFKADPLTKLQFWTYKPAVFTAG